MKRTIVSGYFSPLNGGHLDLLQAASQLGDYLIVIVNNDEQQKLKKGHVVLNQQDRLRIMRELRPVDEALLSVDKTLPVVKTLELLAEKYIGDELTFANGGDRDDEAKIPEAAVCKRHGIVTIFNVGRNK